jgi:hypothetical protein
VPVTGEPARPVSAPDSTAPAPVSGSEAVLAESMARLRSAVAAARAVGVCRASTQSLQPTGTGARSALIDAAMRARARGLAREYAIRVMGRQGDAALVERLQPGPWSTRVDPAHEGLLRALVEVARAPKPSTAQPTRGGWFAPVTPPDC